MVKEIKGKTRKVAPKANPSANKQKEDKEGLNLDAYKDLRTLIFRCKDNPYEIVFDIQAHIKKLLNEFEISKDYNILFIHDEKGRISRYTLDKFYSFLSKMDRKKDLLLVLHTSGGEIEPAYFISKCCKEYSKKFVVVIPRQAKSAATLIALGADKIHMGDISELGPIDPQIQGLPSLALGEAIKYLTRIIKNYPESSNMFAKYLSFKLDLQTLGYFERVAESAVDYGKRLLKGKTFPSGMTAATIAYQLVYGYKDHSFVIDKDEAKTILGNVVEYRTPEYKLADRIYKFLDLFDTALWTIFGDECSFHLIGSIEGGLFLRHKK